MNDFCKELHERTKATHDRSDKLINLKLVAVLTNRRLYGEALGHFYLVYDAIETALERNRDNPKISPIIMRSMFRTDAFEKDLSYFLGEDWKSKLAKSPEVTAYCDRVYEIASKEPFLLVAYAHSMFLAILAGGRTLKKIIKRTLGLSGEYGLDVFEIEDSDNVKAQFKQAINHLELTRQEKDEIIEEKMHIFKMNNAIASSIKPTIWSFRRVGVFLMLFIIPLCAVLYKAMQGTES